MFLPVKEKRHLTYMRSNQKILITGANGFLGQHLVLYLSQSFDVIASGKSICRIEEQQNFSYEPIDLTDKASIVSLVEKIKPTIIIHNAAMSKPDECENNKQACLANNVTATQFLIDAAIPFNPHFIYVSTDFIFGEGGPHKEDDIPQPLNFYGESKLAAEKIVVNSGLKYAIIRPVLIYGEQLTGTRPSFLHWVKQNLEQDNPIKVVSDQERTPTYTKDICKGIETIILKKEIGAFHLAGKEVLSPYQMALMVAKELNLDASLIESVTAGTFPEPVKRAKKSGLNIDKAIAQLNYNPVSFEEGIHLTFRL
jgi:dTDP-4-dehydrorhamnose reductase